MKKILLLALAAVGAVVGYRRYQERAATKASWKSATDSVD
ncbi:DLW-39 family protein [Galactobacter valiniphilus]|nr:DLW-39 family protein [Galactobacter valiniphilus]MDR2255757.1 DLW-39 family protein [Arthrobacter sp.]